jgi:hypothetical protein
VLLTEAVEEVFHLGQVEPVAVVAHLMEWEQMVWVAVPRLIETVYQKGAEVL